MWAQNEDGFTLVHLCSTSLAMQRAGISWVLGLDSSYLGALYCWEKKSKKSIKFPCELSEASIPPFPHSSQEPSNPPAADSLLLASPLRGETHPLPDL